MRGSTHRIPGLVLTDHELDLPLDPVAPLDPAAPLEPAGGETIRVFAREVVAVEREHADLPWLLFLQGGPGHGAPRPLGRTGWIGRAVEEFRVLLLDQRGTGQSAPRTAQTLARLTDDAARAAHLTHFRADAIVRDAERARHALCGGAPWTVLGQSFGGFCLAHYLCAAPEGLAGGIFTGGLPPLDASADEVYRRTYRHLAAKTDAYDARYPGDAERATRLARHLAERDVRLPCGDRLTPRRLQLLGLHLGASDGFETLHYLLEDAFVEGARGPEVAYAFLRGVENALGYDTHPIYSLLHEACYAQGQATRWAAERVRAEHPELDPAATPFRFTGEMVYPWFFDEFAALAPLKNTAELLAAHEPWPALYDRARLAANAVPCVAAIYEQDLYVDRDFSKETAAAIRGLRAWVTSEHEHNALRADGEKLLGRLLDLLRGRA